VTSTWSEARHKLNQLCRGTGGQGHDLLSSVNVGAGITLLNSRIFLVNCVLRPENKTQPCISNSGTVPKTASLERLYISILLEVQSPRDAGACSTTPNQVK